MGTHHSRSWGLVTQPNSTLKLSPNETSVLKIRLQMILRRTKPATRGSMKQAERLVCWNGRVGVGFESSHIFTSRVPANTSYATSLRQPRLTFAFDCPLIQLSYPFWGRWCLMSCGIFPRVPQRSAREHIADGLRLNLHEFVPARPESRRSTGGRGAKLDRDRYMTDPRSVLFQAVLCNRARNHPIINAFPLIWYRNLFWRRFFLSDAISRHKTEKSIESENDVEWRLFAGCYLLIQFPLYARFLLAHKRDFHLSRKPFTFFQLFKFNFKRNSQCCFFLTS